MAICGWEDVVRREIDGTCVRDGWIKTNEARCAGCAMLCSDGLNLAEKQGLGLASFGMKRLLVETATGCREEGRIMV